jgi:hypothetical protein
MMRGQLEMENIECRRQREEKSDETALALATQAKN